MIQKVLKYEVINAERPSYDDVENAIEVAKEEQCNVQLTWKGFQHIRDSCSVFLSSSDNAQEVYEKIKEQQ